MGKNYIVQKDNYQPLSDIMGQDYDTTKAYKIYVNSISLGLLNYLYTADTPTNSEIGREITSYTIIDVVKDTGDNVYLRGTASNINIYIE